MPRKGKTRARGLVGFLDRRRYQTLLRTRESYSRLFSFRRFAAWALVALLQRRCSGARGSVRSKSS